MDSITVELKLLIECLKKKESALEQIASITENQGFVLTSEVSHDEIYSFFMQMNTEKQSLIDKVLEYDQVFEDVLKKAGPILDENPTKYGDEVKTMQDLIRSVMDLDVRIRVEEQKNHQVLVDALPKEALKEGMQKNAKGSKDGRKKPTPISGGEHSERKIVKAYEKQSKQF